MTENFHFDLCPSFESPPKKGFLSDGQSSTQCRLAGKAPRRVCLRGEAPGVESGARLAQGCTGGKFKFDPEGQNPLEEAAPPDDGDAAGRGVQNIIGLGFQVPSGGEKNLVVANGPAPSTPALFSRVDFGETSWDNGCKSEVLLSVLASVPWLFSPPGASCCFFLPKDHTNGNDDF